MDVNCTTVHRYVRASSVDVLVAGGVQVSVLDPLKPYLNGRLAAGERNATRCWPRSPGRGYTGDKNTLTKWISAVAADLRALRAFTTGLHRDLDAVVAGLTMRHNSGAVERTVNRIKQSKAAMYGRAKPDLLRKLILLA